MTTKTTVSILIPCYNHAKFVPQAIESAIKQSYPVHEIVVVNDGSTDNSAEVLEGLAKKYQGIVKVYHQKNAGPAWTRQQAAEKATGQFVVPLDADDLLHTDAVKTWLEYQKANPRFTVVYGDYYRIDENNTVIDEYKVSQRRDDPLEGNILNTLIRQNAVTATSLIRRDKVLEVGGYYSEDTSHVGRGHEDYFLYLKLLVAGYEFGYVPKTLFYYRNTPGSVSNRKSGFYENRLAVLKHIYRLDVDRLVDATDYATWKRVDQLNDAFFTLGVRQQEIEALKGQVSALQTQLNEAQAQLTALKAKPIPPAPIPEPTPPPKLPDLIPSPNLPTSPTAANAAPPLPNLSDVQAQLDELARIKASRTYNLLYRILDPKLNAGNQ
jgi:glycosyltransferase involved in cell wall biosynthesis